ncbi:ATP-binding protein [Chamaesiphon sp.]|uniref:sensor histidine kinase n=1 Tax=Chamaesiphon sp. TaxID=2814140 RepID=UPI003593A68B
MTQSVNTDSIDRQRYRHPTVVNSLKLGDDNITHHRCLLERIATIVWATDRVGEAQGEHVDWAAFTGQTTAQMQADGWLEAVHPADRAATVNAWVVAVEQATPFQVQYQLRHHSGAYRWMDVQGVPVLNPDGSIAQWVGCHIDITDLKLAELVTTTQAQELTQLQLAITQMTELLDRRERELDQVIYTLAHDLHAPLRAIANLSQWIEEDITGQVSAQNQQQLQLLRNRVNLIQAMIDGLLAHSRIGRREVRTETVVVAELVAEVIEDLAPPPNFAIAIAVDLPTLQTKRGSLAQVFSQLIGNAIHHHPALGATPTEAVDGLLPTRVDGNIQISGQLRPDSYEFAVTDDGCGIASEHHESIFGIFKTLATKTVGVASPVEHRPGMGLPIVKKIVESEGGQVRVSSTVGEGSTFHFTWSGSTSVKG